MSVLFFTTFEKELGDIQSEKPYDGDALTSTIVELDSVAEELNLTPITGFYSWTEGEPYDEDEFDGEQPEEKWFPAADGLRTFQGLLNYLRSDTQTLRLLQLQCESGANLIEDLEFIEEELKVAVERGIRFHMSTE